MNSTAKPNRYRNNSANTSPTAYFSEEKFCNQDSKDSATGAQMIAVQTTANNKKNRPIFRNGKKYPAPLAQKKRPEACSGEATQASKPASVKTEKNNQTSSNHRNWPMSGVMEAP